MQLKALNETWRENPLGVILNACKTDKWSGRKFHPVDKGDYSNTEMRHVLSAKFNYFPRFQRAKLRYPWIPPTTLMTRGPTIKFVSYTRRNIREFLSTLLIIVSTSISTKDLFSGWPLSPRRLRKIFWNYRMINYYIEIWIIYEYIIFLTIRKIYLSIL